MGKLSLNKLPEVSRYESSCQVLDRSDIDPPYFGLPFKGNRKSTFYLTSNGDICAWPKSKSFPPLVAFSLRDVSKVEYHPKRIVHPIKYFMIRSTCAVLGIIVFIWTGLIIQDFVMNFEEYYYFSPDPSNPEATSTNYGDVVSETIWQTKYLFQTVLVMCVPAFLFFYAIGRVHVWAERERLDFEVRSGEDISFYGKLPLEGWFSFSYYGTYSFYAVVFPVLFLQPWVAVPVMISLLAFAAVAILILLARDLLKEEDFEPDDFLGDAKIMPLEGFYLDVLRISNEESEGELVKEKNYQFI